jgi:formate dehydrogenase maturation protein FdhE
MSESDLSATASTRVCPFCQKGPVATTGRKADDAAYWRCQACGQMWNPSRLAAAQQRRW